ncbi:mechanosensitive ion channel family protein [Gimibacter soli]|uniref:Small-conductance mechanosensitive channel n=1 Tax=Gimibacter soli TaxID=3024400 RepID=A0AAF0BHW0_9PROT|nr:mechanosensitive ion channel domain-containing protein [Gimibacter soli]WCL54673.1 mechanosensitive ion channel [Gimibacter soli]
MDEAQIRDLVDQLVLLATTYGLSVLGAVVILIIGFWLAGRARHLTTKALGRTGKIDETVSEFLGSLVKYVVIGVTIIAVLGQFGVETTSLVAVFGAAGLAVGLALQGTLSNVAAGVMLLIFRPFRVGHYIEVAGLAGTAKGITLFTTELDTPDNIRVTVPNGMIWGAAIRNFGYHETRRVDMTFGIGYGMDVGKAFEAIRGVIEKDARILKDPEPLLVVGNLGASSVDLIVRVWTQGTEYWNVKFDMTRAVKEAFDSNGIEIPFPHQVLISKQG